MFCVLSACTQQNGLLTEGAHIKMRIKDKDPPAPQDDTDQLVNPLILSKLHTMYGYGHLEYTPFLMQLDIAW